jgi:hypothetical protein
MINYQEFRELYNRLPRLRICQKQNWQETQKALEKENPKHNLVLIARPATQDVLKIAWLLKDSVLIYSLSQSKEQEYSKGETIEEISRLKLDDSFQYSLARVNSTETLTQSSIESLFEIYRQGKLPGPINESQLTTLLVETASRHASDDGDSRERIIRLFASQLSLQLTNDVDDVNDIFHKAEENVLLQLGDEEQRRKFQAIIPLWQKLFAAFYTTHAARCHVQFFSMHILPVFAEVTWPQPFGE